MKFIEHLTVLLEPTGACNLRCRHCYHSKTEYLSKKMSLQTLDKFLSICAPHYKNIKIIWHGGEPLLMDNDFYVSAYKKFNEYSSNFGTKFTFGIQTNGTLLNDKLIELFKNTKTIISISYDGMFNDVLRQETLKTQKTIVMLQENEIKFSCLSTISKANVSHLIELYDYFKKLNIAEVKFNPILPDGMARDCDYLISKEEWTDNFIKLFEHWFFDTECNLKMKSCTDILNKYFGVVKRGCLNGTCLFSYIAIDAYGNLYPCGRLIENQYKLSNIYEIDDIRQAFGGDAYKEILNKNKERMDKCKNCKWFFKCHSGCNASASLTGDMSNKFDFECYFISHMFAYLDELFECFDRSKINKYAIEILDRLTK